MRQESCIAILPDVEMYGGDTTPWQIFIAHENGNPYTVDELDGYTATLYLIPYYMNTGVSVSGAPVLTKSGTFKAVDGVGAVEFAMAASDTKTLAGKYTYQVEFHYGTACRIGQGKVHIRTNINRS